MVEIEILVIILVIFVFMILILMSTGNFKLFVGLILIIALAVAGGYAYKYNFFDNFFGDVQSKNELEDYNDKIENWIEDYKEILSDEANFQDFKDVKLQLCDLNGDKNPELIVIGTQKSNKISCNIYGINDDVVESNLEDDFIFNYLYNKEEDTYNWYIVTSKAKKVYELNLLEKDYNIEKSKYSYSEDFEVVYEGTRINFDISEDDVEETLEALEKTFVDVSGMFLDTKKEDEEQESTSNILKSKTTNNTKNEASDSINNVTSNTKNEASNSITNNTNSTENKSSNSIENNLANEAIFF